LADERDYQTLRADHARATDSRAEPEKRDAAQAGTKPELTAAEIDEKLAQRRERILDEMRAGKKFDERDIVWKERQLESEPRDDQIRAMKSEEERAARKRGNDLAGKPLQNPSDEALRRIDKIVNDHKLFEAGEQARQNSAGRDGRGGRD